MGSTPKAPAPTAMDKYLQRRQLMTLDELDVRENATKSAIARGRLGQRMLLSGSPLGIVDEGMAEAALKGTRRPRRSAASAAGEGAAGGALGAREGRQGRTWAGGGPGTEVP